MIKFANPFQMNDWKFKNFIGLIIALQLSVLGIPLMSTIGIQIPIIRQLIGFIYLTFVPGILILRIFKLHKLGNIKTILYSVGLSLSFLMFVSFLMNLIYPILGIEEPISFLSLITTITFFMVILCILAYLRDKNFAETIYLNIKINPIFLLLILTPFLAILGTYSVNYFDNNIILMILLLFIATIVILVAFEKIPKTLYPLTVFVISISLLFHTSLITNYIWGCDINYEYYFAKLVLNNSYWNFSIPSNVNAMLSTTILAPIFSNILGMNLVWVFKIIYPFLFSLVSLGLYNIFKEQSNGKIAFLSVFFFMAIFTFYTEMNQLCRQEIAELYFLLLIMLMIDYDMGKMKRSLLGIIFAFSLIVSHYGLSYICMLMFLTATILVYVLNKASLYRLTQKIRMNKSIDNSHSNLNYKAFTLSFVLLFFVFAFSWYIYVSSSSAFDSVVNIGNHILSSISTDLLDPKAVQGLSVLNAQISSPLHQIPKYLNLLFQFFILIGVFSNLKSIKKFKVEYVIFALISLFILGLSVVLPYFASSLNMTRIYHITLFFLAPFAIIGGINSFKFIYNLFNGSWTKKQFRTSFKIISIMVVILFLFYTGFIYEITGDNPTSFAISKTNGGYPIFSDQEVESAKWLSVFENESYIYADGYQRYLITDFEPKEKIRSFPEDLSKLYGDPYLFLGKSNLLNNTLLVTSTVKASKKQIYTPLGNLIIAKNAIYDNGGSLILN